MRLVVFLACCCAFGQTWQTQESGTTASLRGLSVVDDSVVWASGSTGTVMRTVDQGATWTSIGPAGAADVDFRDIQAFSATEAIAMSAGEGRLSRLYKTTDGGATWTLLKSNGPQGFWDAFGMWDATHGILLGDPVDGRFTILATSDGRTWNALEGPKAEKGEAAFAASGTALITRGTREAWFATGGTGGGRIIGSSDRIGGYPASRPLEPKDLAATMLHLLGVDHEQLTYRFQGRRYRLTDVHGEVLEGVLA